MFFIYKKRENHDQNNTTLLTSKFYYIYKKVFLGHWVAQCSFRRLFCSFTHTFTHAYIYTHGLIIAMHTVHVKKSHSDCSQCLIKNHPNWLLCCLLLIHHVFVSFVFYFMQFKTPRPLYLHSNSPFPLSQKSAVICRRSKRNCRNKPYIAKSSYCLLSGAIWIIWCCKLW